MGKIKQLRIDQFDGGWTNDLRDKQANKSPAVAHFDIRTRQRRLTPYRDMESADSDPNTNFITQFLAYGTKIFGFGTASGGATPRIWERSDFTGNTWTAATSAGTGTRYPYIFIDQGNPPNNPNAYMWETTTPAIYNTDLTSPSTPSIAHPGGWFSGATFFGQPCVHSKDKKLYMPYNNKLARFDSAVLLEENVLAIPSSQQIPCVSEYGNYLAIAARPISSRVDNSICYLWDRDSSLSTLSELYDLGSEAVQILDSIDGELIAISANINVTSANLFPKVVFRRFNGLYFEKFFELECSAILSSQVIQRQKYNGKLYFNLVATINGTDYAGIWSIGRSAPGQPLTVTLEYVVDPTNTVTAIYGFKFFNDYLFVSYHYGSSEAMSKTNDSASYTTTSFYETPIWNGEDASIKKKLLGVTLETAPLPTAGQVILKYKADGDTSWTTIFTHNTDNSISHSAINIESSGANLPEFKEIRFRIESTGGAEITGFSCNAELTHRDGAYD